MTVNELKMNKKEEFVNCVIDALGIVIIFVAGYFSASINYMWYNPLIGVISIIIGYVLIKGIVTFPEDRD